jgi:hypothetical protein
MRKALGLVALLVMPGAWARGEDPPPEDLPPEAPPAEGPRESGMCCSPLLAVMEALFPDVRLQLGDPARWVLSWPVHLTLTPAETLRQQARFVSAFIEPQWLPQTGAFRMLTGARAGVGGWPHGYTLLAEAGAVAGTDGLGGMAGVGAGLGGALFQGAYVLRRSWTSGGARWDMTLEFTIPLNTRPAPPAPHPASPAGNMP